MAEEVYGIQPGRVTGMPHSTEIAVVSAGSDVAEVISLSDSSGKGTPNMVRKLTVTRVQKLGSAISKMNSEITSEIMSKFISEIALPSLCNREILII